MQPKRTNTFDYSAFDQPEILRVLFYPRSEWSYSFLQRNTLKLMIPVEDQIEIQVQAYICSHKSPNILFFHGNGEIASDYQEIAPFYTERNINLFVADYRGYGRSMGVPTVSAMMKDCLTIFRYLMQWLYDENYSGHIFVMGRSLGSASAIEIAHNYEKEIAGLIIESGFAYIGPLLQLMGVRMGDLNLNEELGLRNICKIKEIKTPTLVIHAQYDHIISYNEGKALFEASPAEHKKILRIPCANHNNVFIVGMIDYMAAIEWLLGCANQTEP